MADIRFITAILPLRLEWEPCYSVTDQEVKMGSRIRVPFSGRIYPAVVSAVDIAPGTDERKIKPVISIDDDLDPISVEMLQLWRRIAAYYLCSVGEVFKAAYPAGKITSEEIRARLKKKKEERTNKIAADLDRKIEMLERRYSSKLEHLAHASQTRTRERYSAEAETLKRQIDEFSAKKESATSEDAQNAEISDKSLPQDVIRLSQPQKEAFGKISEALSEKKVVLLNGVTGSGKTEIYVKLALETLESGRNVLYLVPEIALSRQLENRLSSIFGKRLLTFHSGETIARRQEVSEIVAKESYVVLGTRSSLFLPHHDLGLVIVDEEHDTSYKQDEPSPRYNGRDAAIFLGAIFDSRVILGSATPSAESLYNCLSGRYAEVKLDERYYGSSDADLEIIDTSAERRKNGMIGDFSRKLISHIENALARKEQVMILRARRAYSLIVQCGSCGNIVKCPHCNVPLSLHKSSDGKMKLVCRYCGRKSDFDGKCPECGGNLETLGSGTQKIEEEAKILFPSAEIARLDSDIAKNDIKENEIIKSFAKGNIDILIGTQIITKGFDFNGLTLVAVLQADSLLGLQDFRADERALQLLCQFRGRCGRRDKKGLFAIQTNIPNHPVYKALANDNGSGGPSFNSRLLNERRQFGYPPYSRLITVIIRDTNGPRLEKLSAMLATDIKGRFKNAIGPFSPAVDKISDQGIRHMMITFQKDKDLSTNKKDLYALISSFCREKSYSSHVAIDVDPI